MSAMSVKNALEDIFQKFLEKQSLFKNREALSHEYLPDSFPHRDEQIKFIAEVMAPALRGFKPSNLFIYGKTGTGKTAVVRYVLSILKEMAGNLFSSLKTFYINCRLVGSEYRVYFTMCSGLGFRVPFTGLSIGELFERFCRYLDESRALFIIVLDEIDALVKDSGDEILYNLTRINEILKYSKVSLIGISNNLKFKELLEPKVLSSLSEEEIVFRPYNASELKDILWQRAKLAFYDGVVDEGTINLCSALAASEHGDARRALDLLRVAGELAEREGSDKIYERHVREAERRIEYDRVMEVMKNLPLHSKLIMCSLYFLEQSSLEYSITGDIYDVYNHLCSLLSTFPLTQRRVSGLINELDSLGLLNARVTSFGRYGRSKKIKLAVEPDLVYEVFSRDSRLKSILNLRLEEICGSPKKRRDRTG